MEEVKPDRHAIAVDDGDRADPASAHELEDVGPAVAGRDREERPGEDRRHGALEGRAAEERAADVAVGHDPGQPAVAVDREGDPAGSAVEGDHRLADRPGLGHEADGEGVGHRMARAGPAQPRMCAVTA